MKPDMTARAVTQRLRRTAELRRLCLALRRRPGLRVKESQGTYCTPKKSTQDLTDPV